MKEIVLKKSYYHFQNDGEINIIIKQCKLM